MEKNEAAAMAAAVDLRPKNFVRQLDFSMMGGSVILPEHPQAQLQSKLLALVKSRAPPPPEIQPKSPSKAGVKRRFPSQLLPEMVVPVVRRPVVPEMQHPRLALPVISQSPKPRQQSNLELKESTPKKQKQCNCRNS